MTEVSALVSECRTARIDIALFEPLSSVLLPESGFLLYLGNLTDSWPKESQLLPDSSASSLWNSLSCQSQTLKYVPNCQFWTWILRMSQLCNFSELAGSIGIQLSTDRCSTFSWTRADDLNRQPYKFPAGCHRSEVTGLKANCPAQLLHTLRILYICSLFKIGRDLSRGRKDVLLTRLARFS